MLSVIKLASASTVQKTKRVMRRLEHTIAYARPGKPIYDYIDPGLYLDSSRLTWVPSPVLITNDVASFQGPIVNLDEDQHPDIKLHLSDLLTKMLAMFKEVVSNFPGSTSTHTYWVVKAEGYHLIDGKTSQAEGEFHTEGGLGYEDIAAVGLFYYERSPSLEGGHLILKQEATQKKSTLPVHEGTMIVFNNKAHLHKMGHLTSHGGGNRKFIAFFLMESKSVSSHTNNTDVNHRFCWAKELSVFFPQVIVKVITQFEYDITDALIQREVLREARKKRYRLSLFGDGVITDNDSEEEDGDEERERHHCNED